MSICVEKEQYLNVLESTGTLTFVPNGNSMWPFIKNRSQTVIIQKPSAPLKVYDVVFYLRPDGNYVLHRIIADQGDVYLVRGDSLLVTEQVPKSWIIGVMTGFYKGKTFVSANDSKYLAEVEKWHKHSPLTKLKIKSFHFWQRVKNKLKRIFKVKEIQ